jgi:superfamily II DNA or RNA helicase
VFGEGVDVPALVYAGLLRPTQSLSLHLQQVGRTLRIMPNKEFAVIADHAGNAFRHGLPDMPREWTLDDRAKRKTGVNDDAMAIRQCPECFRISPASVSRCPECDYGFPVRISPIAMQAGELFELEAIVTRERRKQEEKEARSMAELIRLGERRGYPNPAGWAAGKLKQRQHFAGKFKPGGRFRRQG